MGLNYLTNGEATTPAKWNGNVDEISNNSSVRIHRKNYINNNLRYAGGSEILIDTFDLVAPINSMILSINVKIDCEQVTATANNINGYFSLSGTNLGTLYLTTRNYKMDGNVWIENWPYLGTVKDSGAFFSRYGNIGVSLTKPVIVLDSTTTFNLYLSGLSANNIKITNVIVDIVYISNYIED